jgi:Na+-transporting methylmalonyl-CoA/oxaloacetate decarboxylase gamma subunit
LIDWLRASCFFLGLGRSSSSLTDRSILLSTNEGMIYLFLFLFLLLVWPGYLSQMDRSSLGRNNQATSALFC